MYSQIHLIVDNSDPTEVTTPRPRGLLGSWGETTYWDDQDRLLDNDVSRTPYPWAPYIGHSKIQRMILIILSDREIWDREVWRGALSLRAVRQLLFKGKSMVNSERASFSRSIRRLGKEGLINRERCMSDDGYTSHIGLTQRGWYQVEFEKTWYSNKQTVELLTFYGLLSSKYGKKVNKKRKRVSRHTKG